MTEIMNTKPRKPGTLVIDNFCYQDTIFGCLGRVDATISGSPPPSIDSFSIDVEPMIGLIGPVVGVHAGPGTVGIAWIDSA